MCELNDKDFAYANYSFYESLETAVQRAMDACKRWNKECKVEIEDEGRRITGHYGNAFYVTEIKRICSECGTHLLVWHHGYDGVDFEIRHQGTYEECKKGMDEEIRNLIDDLELLEGDICCNVIDTGKEREVFDIVEINIKQYI